MDWHTPQNAAWQPLKWMVLAVSGLTRCLSEAMPVVLLPALVVCVQVQTQGQQDSCILRPYQQQQPLSDTPFSGPSVLEVPSEGCNGGYQH